MSEAVNLEKKKEILEQRQENVSQQVSVSVDNQGLPDLETKSREQAEAIARIKDSLNAFSSEFRMEWGRPVTAESNLYRSTVKLAKKIWNGGSVPTPNFSLNSFAYGDEIPNSEEIEKRSGTATDLMDNLNEFYELTGNKNGIPEPAESMRKLFELAQSSKNYCVTHKKKFFNSTLANGRNLVAEKVRKMTSDCLSKMLSEKDKNDIYNNDIDEDFKLGESEKTIEKELKRSAKAYHNYVIQMAKKSHGHTSGEILKRKLKALRLCERYIKVYRSKHKEEDDRDPEINALIREYEECLAWEKLLKFTENKEEKEVDLDEMIDQHLVEEGELESQEKNKIVPENETEELEPAQLKGIEEIDRWLVRNFQNGGITGTLLPFLKNPNVDFVNRVLSLSKRERLHMYYLVEKKKRRDSNFLDVGLSQNYVPDFKEFRNQMVASKFKFWKRMNGEYTYIHKLSEAFKVTEQYRNEIRSVAEIEREKKAELQNVEKAKDSEEKVDEAATERLKKMMLLKGALEEYGRNLDTAKNTDKKKKAAAEAICKESASYCEQLMKEIARLDNSVEKEDLYKRDKEKDEVVAAEAASKYMMPGKFANPGQTAFIKGTGIFGKKWNLGSSGWENANLWTGSITEAAGGVANLIGAVTGLITLCKTGNTMAGTEAAEKALQMTQSLVSTTQNALNITFLVKTGGAIIKTASETQVQELMGRSFAAAGAVINTGIAISRAVGVSRMQRHGEKAGNYFKNKRETLEKQGKDKLTKEQKRELKYEENMMRLQEDLKHREEIRRNYGAVSAGISIASILVPTIGLANLAVAIVASIHDGMEVTKLRTKLFDNFFNIDALAEKVAKQRLKGSRKNSIHNQGDQEKERVKEALRFRVAAYAGFCDMRTAAEFVCTKFARLIREKIFGDNPDISDEERNGYIEFVKALNLRYNKKKGLPDESILVRKLSAQ